ncbi:MAG: endonuclease/exonuclease/phosphatase family protein [Clostridia bacterium]|nr:endonuclease/exonuclease/phosphatase family protein [Clostridia bacterium]
MKKRILAVILALLGAVLLTVIIYVVYVFASYSRVADMEPCPPAGSAQAETAEIGREYHMLSFNIGFGAYEPDFGFFMDGGTEARAFSKERLTANIAAIGEFLVSRSPDFLLLQEVDEDATRSHHFNERKYFTEQLGSYAHTWAQNWDCAYLFYPLTQPHGAARSGLMTFSSVGITDGLRRSLPVETSVMKIVDLDRCYSVSRVPTSDGHELVIYNTHLSAYTSDGTIAIEQLEMLLGDMQSEYEKGNYCICAGDFNKDLLGNSAAIFGVSDHGYTWAQPIPAGTFDGHDIILSVPFDADNPVPSCRNADGPYHPEQYVVTVDGYLVSRNVEVHLCQVIDTQFAYSDHNPTEMTFVLLP